MDLRGLRLRRGDGQRGGEKSGGEGRGVVESKNILKVDPARREGIHSHPVLVVVASLSKCTSLVKCSGRSDQ